MIRRPDDRVCHIRIETAPNVIQHAQGHDVGSPVDAGNACRVVACGGGNSRHVRAVSKFIVRVWVAIGKRLIIYVVIARHDAPRKFGMRGI